MLLMRKNHLSVKTGFLHVENRSIETPDIYFNSALSKAMFSDENRDFARRC
jgi:hypothetical protein